eukprot:908824-Rhodomonas_salina.1
MIHFSWETGRVPLRAHNAHAPPGTRVTWDTLARPSPSTQISDLSRGGAHADALRRATGKSAGSEELWSRHGPDSASH